MTVTVTRRQTRKEAGAYYTPEPVARTLARWVIRGEGDRLLDPSAGDGRIIALHRNSVGVEQDPQAAREAMARAPWALVHEGDFFTWAAETAERFTCAGGNPPFIRYQTFKGEVRERALALCRRLGVEFSGLSSSWAPFLAAAAGLVEPGGRIGFVVPAEIGHAPYAGPLLDFLTAEFSVVHIVAYRAKLFPELSEDCWLLYAEGRGGSTREIRLSIRAAFAPSESPPNDFTRVSVAEWRDVWKRRLRPFLLPEAVRSIYAEVLAHAGTRRLGDIARIGIGYVTGDNNFFHLRPSEADRWDVPASLLREAVRKGEVLPPRRLTRATVDAWRRSDEKMLLLNLPKGIDLPPGVRRYLETDEAKAAQTSYKCRNRTPWYVVPDVQTPDFFLSYMSGVEPSLVRNDARCTCTNSVHAVRLKEPDAAARLSAVWESELLRLSCELEGHPLGGGMLKLEPGEATQVVVPPPDLLSRLPSRLLAEGVAAMREWRHYGAEAYPAAR